MASSKNTPTPPTPGEAPEEVVAARTTEETVSPGAAPQVAPPASGDASGGVSGSAGAAETFAARVVAGVAALGLLGSASDPTAVRVVREDPDGRGVLLGFSGASQDAPHRATQALVYGYLPAGAGANAATEAAWTYEGTGPDTAGGGPLIVYLHARAAGA